MKQLRIAEHLTLPIEVVTEKLAFLGRTGSGKTYAAMKLAELMLEAGAQIISLDPVGAWHGLRIGGSWNVYIFGGMRGDFPLEPTGGKLMADLVADRGISAVLDVSQFIRAEQVRFASDFIERFFHRKKAAPSAVHVFLEECQEFVPQNPGDREAHMLHHFERAWKLGRNFGIGGSLISQRPQEINKKALNQAGTLFVFNMTGPQERRAIADWTRQAGIDEDIESVLPTLKVGEPHVWSPTFLEVSKTVRILPKLTADVSMTPKVGARTKEQPLTPIDVQELTTQMAATIEKSKAEDPKELRKQILSLKQEIVALKQEKPEAVKLERVEVSVLTDADRTRLGTIAKIAEAIRADLDTTMRTLGDIQSICSRVSTSTVQPTSPKPSYKITEKRQTTPLRQSNGNGTAMLRAPRKVLNVLAQYPQGRSKTQIAILAGYAHSGGGFNNALGWLRSQGYIQGSDHIQITQTGLDALGSFEPLPVGQDLLRHWYSNLNKAERAALECLADTYPQSLSKEEVANRTGYEANGGGFNNALSKLRTLELISGRGELVASDALFE